MPTNLIRFWKSSDKYFLTSIVITILSVITILLFFLISYNQLPDKLPLFYSLFWGEEQLAVKQQFFLLPITLTLVCLVNSLITSQLHTAQYLLKRMLMLSLIVIDLIIVTTALKIIWIFI